LNNPSMPVSRMNKKFARSAITSVIFWSSKTLPNSQLFQVYLFR
jgi:hypothetical protein